MTVISEAPSMSEQPRWEFNARSNMVELRNDFYCFQRVSTSIYEKMTRATKLDRIRTAEKSWEWVKAEYERQKRKENRNIW